MATLNHIAKNGVGVFLVTDDGTQILYDKDDTVLVIEEGLHLSKVSTNAGSLTNVSRNSGTLSNINKS